MSGCQKTTVLVLLCAVIVVFWALLQVVESALEQPEVPASPFVLHTPTATATSTMLPSETREPILSPTVIVSPAQTPTFIPTDTATATPVPPSPTPSPSSTATQRPLPSPTSVPQRTVPAEVAGYLRDFTSLVSAVDQMGLLESSARADQGTADQLRGVYRHLHEMVVPEGAEEMHLAFITYVSVLEERCLCKVFAEAHSADAQGQYYRQCEGRAASVAVDLLSKRFLPSRDAFLQRYSLSAGEAGFTD
ncbi:MAG TPA: hypothetical protein VJ714_07810 [Anaerolineae bacterium]|nr:hypothetical protein [Anaerolineae bacterium]